MSDYTNRIEEAITEQFGERCPDFDAGCACCQAWAKLDRLKKFVDHAAGYAIELEQEQSRLDGVIKAQRDELDRLTAENSRIRAALATSSGACVYCSLTAEEWAKCSAGFPGCARADDAMGCPELGARLELEQLKTDLAESEKRVWNAAIEAADAALLTRSCTCFEAIRALKKDKP